MDPAITPQDPQGGGAGAATPAADAPQAIELNDDSLVRIPGAKDPVKYGEHFRGLQSELTKRAQAAKKLEEGRAELERRLQEREGQLRQYVEAVQRYQSRGGQQQQADPYADLENAPYVTGKQAAEMLRRLSEQAGGFRPEIQQRDQAILMLGQVIKQLRDQVNSFATERSEANEAEKVRKFVKDGGYPEEAYDLARELYAGYEGDNLDEDFPNIFKRRWEQVIALARKLDQDKLRAGRLAPWTPGKGGNGSASKPLTFKDHSPKGIADALWGSIENGEGT